MNRDLFQTAPKSNRKIAANLNNSRKWNKDIRKERNGEQQKADESVVVPMLNIEF